MPENGSFLLSPAKSIGKVALRATPFIILEPNPPMRLHDASHSQHVFHCSYLFSTLDITKDKR